MEYLHQNYLLNIPFIEALERGDATLLSFDKDGAAALHNQDILMLSLTSDAALQKYGEMITQKVSTVFGAQDLSLIDTYFKGFRQVPCHQMVYTKKEPPALESGLDFKLLDIGFAQFVLDTYSNKSFTLESITKLLERKLIFGVYVDGELAGYCGRHREGAMGLLEVFPKFRRRGIGKETERFIIGEVLKEGRVPYGHVVYGNDVSMNLQHQIDGVEFAKECVLWLVQKNPH